MKIDILFLNNDLSDHEEYFDNQTIKEYCETHSFEAVSYTHLRAHET